MHDEKIRIAGIESESITDGEGIRYVVFCQGCPHHCEGCHNPSSWDFNAGIEVSIKDIISQIKQNDLLDGVTFSGGEPFMQVKALIALSKLLKPRYNIWLYTGYLYEDIINDKNKKSLLQYIDVLVDGPFILSQRNLSLTFKGSNNQRIINVPMSLTANEVILK